MIHNVFKIYISYRQVGQRVEVQAEVLVFQNIVDYFLRPRVRASHLSLLNYLVVLAYDTFVRAYHEKSYSALRHEVRGVYPEQVHVVAEVVELFEYRTQVIAVSLAWGE